jgi:hypothetical protein
MILLPEFILKDIEDLYIRENFKRLTSFFQKETLLKSSFKFFELTFTSAVTGNLVQHGLGFKPLDVIQTSSIGSGVATFNFTEFTKDVVSVTTTGPCVIRAFIGAYREDV